MGGFHRFLGLEAPNASKHRISSHRRSTSRDAEKEEEKEKERKSSRKSSTIIVEWPEIPRARIEYEYVPERTQRTSSTPSPRYPTRVAHKGDSPFVAYNNPPRTEFIRKMEHEAGEYHDIPALSNEQSHSARRHSLHEPTSRQAQASNLSKIYKRPAEDNQPRIIRLEGSPRVRFNIDLPTSRFNQNSGQNLQSSRRASKFYSYGQDIIQVEEENAVGGNRKFHEAKEPREKKYQASTQNDSLLNLGLGTPITEFREDMETTASRPASIYSHIRENAADLEPKISSLPPFKEYVVEADSRSFYRLNNSFYSRSRDSLLINTKSEPEVQKSRYQEPANIENDNCRTSSKDSFFTAHEEFEPATSMASRYGESKDVRQDSRRNSVLSRSRANLEEPPADKKNSHRDSVLYRSRANIEEPPADKKNSHRDSATTRSTADPEDPIGDKRNSHRDSVLFRSRANLESPKEESKTSIRFYQPYLLNCKNP